MVTRSAMARNVKGICTLQLGASGAYVLFRVSYLIMYLQGELWVALVLMADAYFCVIVALAGYIGAKFKMKGYLLFYYLAMMEIFIISCTVYFLALVAFPFLMEWLKYVDHAGALAPQLEDNTQGVIMLLVMGGIGLLIEFLAIFASASLREKIPPEEEEEEGAKRRKWRQIKKRAKQRLKRSKADAKKGGKDAKKGGKDAKKGRRGSLGSTLFAGLILS